MAFTIKCDTKKLKSLIKRMEKLDGTEVEVGFFEGDKYGPENLNLPVAMVAFLNEYGHRGRSGISFGGVPERPFMQETFLGNTDQFHMATGMKKVFLGALASDRAVARLLKEVGQMVKEQLQVAIEDYPGSNSAATIKRKGKDDPLNDTGKMLRSVKFKIHKGEK